MGKKKCIWRAMKALLEKKKTHNEIIRNSSDMAASETALDTKKVIQEILDALVANYGSSGMSDIMRNIKEKHFTMRMMNELMRLIRKLDPNHKIYSSLRGMNQLKIIQYLVITDSMTNQERDSENLGVLMDKSRIYRVARGSGSPIERVRELIQLQVHLSEVLKGAYNKEQ